MANGKSLRIALQMDPLSGINPETDSSFVLGLGAQERGHTLYTYQPQHLFWQEGHLRARLWPTTLRREKGNPFTLGAPEIRALDEEVDVILLRQDPPFDMGYITNTFLLELAAQKKPVKIINDPVGVRNAPEKLLITHFPDLIPPTLIASDPAAIGAFAATHGKIVAKRLHGNAGRDVFLFRHDEKALLDFAAQHFAASREPVMLQPFLPAVEEGDKRIILFDGKIAGALRRLPATGDFRANLAQGATAHKTDITDDDRKICAALGPMLRAMGLYFVGLDVIGGKLIEINVTSPTGLQSINALYDLHGKFRMEMLFWQGVEYDIWGQFDE